MTLFVEREQPHFSGKIVLTVFVIIRRNKNKSNRFVPFQKSSVYFKQVHNIPLMFYFLNTFTFYIIFYHNGIINFVSNCLRLYLQIK